MWLTPRRVTCHPSARGDDAHRGEPRDRWDAPRASRWRRAHTRDRARDASPRRPRVERWRRRMMTASRTVASARRRRINRRARRGMSTMDERRGLRRRSSVIFAPVARARWKLEAGSAWARARARRAAAGEHAGPYIANVALTRTPHQAERMITLRVFYRNERSERTERCRHVAACDILLRGGKPRAPGNRNAVRVAFGGNASARADDRVRVIRWNGRDCGQRRVYVPIVRIHSMPSKIKKYEPIVRYLQRGSNPRPQASFIHANVWVESHYYVRSN